MAWALAKEGILVNTVTPGVFHTEALRYFMEMTDATATYSPIISRRFGIGCGT